MAAPTLLARDLHRDALGDYSPQSLANSLWALAQMRVRLNDADVAAVRGALEGEAAAFKPQEFANCLWAVACMDEPPAEFFERLRLSDLHRFEEQHLSNIAWAFGSAGVRRLDVLRSLASEVLQRRGFTLQALANILWAFATLRVQSAPVTEHLRRLAEERLRGAGGVAKQEDVESLLGILWAGGANAAVEESLRRLGRAMDAASGAMEVVALSPRSQQEQRDVEEPTLTLSVAGARVISKPHGWEVDGLADSKTRHGGARQLSLFLASEGSTSVDWRGSWGLINRLDTPSSGLLLQATCFESLFLLQMQRELGLLERDYVVLCLGILPQDRNISARVRKVGKNTVTSLHGRPASTSVKVLAHLKRDSTGLEYSLLALTIHSGRTHQIRCHLAYVGHPVAGDLRYGPFGRDSPSWPGRHFLHRSRLAFTDQAGKRRSVAEPLPADLREALSEMTAIRGGANLKPWLDGDVDTAAKSWGELQRSWQPEPSTCEDEPLELRWCLLGRLKSSHSEAEDVLTWAGC